MIFYIITVKRNRNEIEAQKKSDFEHRRKKKKQKEKKKKEKEKEKKKKTGKKEKSTPPRRPKKVIFYIRTVKRNRNDIEAQKRSDFEHRRKKK